MAGTSTNCADRYWVHISVPALTQEQGFFIGPISGCKATIPWVHISVPALTKNRVF